MVGHQNDPELRIREMTMGAFGSTRASTLQCDLELSDDVCLSSPQDMHPPAIAQSGMCIKAQKAAVKLRSLI